MSTIEEQILAKTTKALQKTAVHFYSSIVLAWPVKTGKSRAAWRITSNGSTFTVSNNVSYSGILWNGRVGGQGSVQMPQGGAPILYASKLKFKEFWEAS